jgi:hypothetical protein
LTHVSDEQRNTDYDLYRGCPQAKYVHTKRSAQAKFITKDTAYLCAVALTESNLVASVEIIVVIFPTECSFRALLERRKDLRKMVDTIPAHEDKG